MKSAIYLILLAGVTGCAPDQDFQPSIEIDGSMNDWSAHTLLWDETGDAGLKPWPLDDSIDIKEMYYANDTDFLYIFMSCDVGSNFNKNPNSSGILAYIYIDSDNDTTTGATEIDDSGSNHVVGADIKIWIPIMVSGSIEGIQKGFDYRLSVFDKASQTFEMDSKFIVREESTLDSNSLISFSDVGVELAIPLKDIEKSIGDNFTFTMLEWAHMEEEHTNQKILTLK
jgi:hypothetical protein